MLRMQADTKVGFFPPYLARASPHCRVGFFCLSDCRQRFALYAWLTGLTEDLGWLHQVLGNICMPCSPKCRKITVFRVYSKPVNQSRSSLTLHGLCLCAQFTAHLVRDALRHGPVGARFRHVDSKDTQTAQDCAPGTAATRRGCVHPIWPFTE